MADFEQQFFDHLIKQNVQSGLAVIENALSSGMPPQHVLLEVVGPAMDRVGQMQEDKEITLSEIFLIASIGDMAIERLLAQMPDHTASGGTVIIGSADGDHHSMGRKVVASFLRAAGFHVVDLGTSVEAERFVDAAIEQHASVICISALLLHTAERIRAVRALLKRRQLERRIKLVVGGAAFNFDPNLYKVVGANGTTRNAARAASVVRLMIGIAEKWPA